MSGTLTGLINAKASKSGDTFTGNVGIGGTSPSEKFNVTEDRAGSFASVIKNTNATGSGLKVIGGDTGQYSLIVRDKDDVTNSLVVLGNGNVGVGTTVNTSVLTVKSDATNDLANGIRLEANGSTNTPVLMYENNTSQGVIELYNQGSSKNFQING